MYPPQLLGSSERIRGETETISTALPKALHCAGRCSLRLLLLKYPRLKRRDRETSGHVIGDPPMPAVFASFGITPGTAVRQLSIAVIILSCKAQMSGIDGMTGRSNSTEDVSDLRGTISDHWFDELPWWMQSAGLTVPAKRLPQAA